VHRKPRDAEEALEVAAAKFPPARKKSSVRKMKVRWFKSEKNYLKVRSVPSSAINRIRIL
jgi:hypothetical protein